MTKTTPEYRRRAHELLEQFFDDWDAGTTPHKVEQSEGFPLDGGAVGYLGGNPLADFAEYVLVDHSAPEVVRPRFLR